MGSRENTGCMWQNLNGLGSLDRYDMRYVNMIPLYTHHTKHDHVKQVGQLEAADCLVFFCW